MRASAKTTPPTEKGLTMREEIIIQRSPRPAHKRRDISSKNERRTVCYEGMFEKFFHARSEYETVSRYSNTGARAAFNALREEARQGVYADKDMAHFANANRYVIFSPHHHETLEELEDRMTHCDMSHIGARTVGCLILGEETYVFFWLKSRVAHN